MVWPWILALLPKAAVILVSFAGIIYAFRVINVRRYKALEKAALKTLMDQWLEKIAQDPSNALAYWQMGRIYEMLGNYELALRSYREAHLACPKAYAVVDYEEAYERLSALSPKINFKTRIQSVSRS